MLMAELKSKVPEVIGMEDVLTSDVFGLIKYLKPDAILTDILSAARNFCEDKSTIIQDRIKDASYFFWPKLSFTCGGKRKVREPDIIIILNNENQSKTAIIVEVKYRSGKSNIYEQQGSESDSNAKDNQEEESELHISDQLVDELQAVYSDDLICEKGLYAELKACCNNKYLLYITGHALFPKLDIEETSDALEKINDKQFGIDSMYWISWHTIYKLINKKSCQNPIFKDLSLILELKGLTPFNGFDNIDLSNVQLLDNYFFKEEFELADGKKIKSVYNAMKQICRETSRVIEITKQYFENKGFYSLAGNSVMWNNSTSYKNYLHWLPYFQQMVFGKKNSDDKTAVGINIVFDEDNLNNTIPFISCGYMEGTKPFSTSDKFYDAGWNDRNNISFDNPFYITIYQDSIIPKIKNYFIPLDSIKNKESIEELIVKPLLLLYHDRDSEARNMIAGKTLTIEDITKTY